MEDISILGICNDYTPSSPAFHIDLENHRLTLNKNINTIIKISCCTESNIEDIFDVLDNNYANVHLSIGIRVDYICDQNNMNFYMVNIDKLININLGKAITQRNLKTESEVLDLGVNNIYENKIDFYILSIISMIK